MWAKTFPALLIGQKGWYSRRCKLTWKLRGTRSSRLYFQLVPSTLPTEGTGSGLLPTPCTVETDNHEKVIDNMSRGLTLKSREAGHNIQNNLTNMGTMGLLPTPSTQEPISDCDITENGRRKTKDGKDSHSLNLGRAVGLLPTPKAVEIEENYEDWQKRMKASGNPKNVGKTTCNIGTMAVSGLLPTPRACESIERRNMKTIVDKVENGGDVTLTTLAKYKGGIMLPTPQSRDERNGSKIEDGRMQRKLEQGWTIDLNDMATSGLLPTPRAQEPGRTSEGYGACLTDIAKGYKTLLPTPDCSDRRGPGSKQQGLSNVMKGMLPTPATRDWKGARSEEALEASGRNHTNSLPDSFAQTGKTSQLSPLFVEEMMGYPITWLVSPFQSGETKV